LPYFVTSVESWCELSTITYHPTQGLFIVNAANASYNPILPGIFIAIEGVDGAGKTTLASRLVNHLQHDLSHGYTGAIYRREPGGTPFGDAVRAAFLHASPPLHPMTEVLGLLACKNELMEKEIRPAIQAGQIVVCDRFTRTLLAYQGGLREVPYKTLLDLLGTTGLLVMPDLELFIHVGKDTSRMRRGTAVNAMDEVAELHADKLRSGYTDAGQMLPVTRRIDIDGEPSEDEVFQTVLSHVLKYLKFHRITGRSINNPIREATEDLQYLDTTPKPIDPLPTLGGDADPAAVRTSLATVPGEETL
jgi:dTMP kinase